MLQYFSFTFLDETTKNLILSHSLNQLTWVFPNVHGLGLCTANISSKFPTEKLMYADKATSWFIH